MKIPITLKAFITGFGHLEHTKSSTFSYLTSAFEIQDEQRYPSYPAAQFIGNFELYENPPFQAFLFGHFVTSVELVVILQYPEFT